MLAKNRQLQVKQPEKNAAAVRRRLLAAVRSFSSLRLLVVGDVMLDVYEFCSTAESKPIDSEKPGKRAYRALESIQALGGAGNVAANLASLGVTTTLVGVTGNDEYYFKLRELAELHGIRHFLVRDPSRLTTVKMRLYLDDEYLLRRDLETTHELDKETALTVLNETLRELREVDAVILSDYDKGVFTREMAREIIKECRMHKKPVVVDFKPPNRTYYAGADIMAPNSHEAAVMIRRFRATDPEEGTRALHKLLRCHITVVTLGEHGICGFDGKTFVHIPANRVEARDPVGCGDTVRAALGLGYTLGLSLRDTLTLANDAAAVIVQKPATARLTTEELAAFISARHGGGEGK
ncbi:MAG: PfkB family carbohydrate kinase [Kiritimatiellae bacterium]|nr:PfkB family carbohydrate kinase [Kiritimatiellia bacterium]